MSLPFADLSARLDNFVRQPRPRLLLDSHLRSKLDTLPPAGSLRGRLLEVLRDSGEKLLALPAVAYPSFDKGFLIPARQAETRVLTLAVLAQQTGDPRWAARAGLEIDALCDLPHWCPSHFLDTSEATFTVAMALDWLWDAWTPDQRETYATAIVEKGLRPSLDETASHNKWLAWDNNWNQVCHASMVIGALAVADRDPEMAAFLIRRALANIDRAAAGYAPDGIYPEGPIYWAYGTTFQMLLAAALETALRDDGGVASFPGLWKSLDYLRQVTTPQGRFYPYADSWIERPSLPILYWFARRAKNPALAASEYRRVEEGREADFNRHSQETARVLPLGMLWMDDSVRITPVEPAAPRAWQGRGKQPLAIFRSQWNDPGALYAAIKGGACNLPHAHADAGSFVVEWAGLEWAAELGSFDYAVILRQGLGLWDYSPASDRWKILHAGPHTHNLVMIDGTGPNVGATAEIIHFSDRLPSPFAILDLSPLYHDFARSYRRGLAFLSPDAVLIVDVFEGLRPSRLRWSFFTPAAVQPVAAGADLSQSDRRFYVRAADDAGGKWEALPLEKVRQPFDAPSRDGSLVVRNIASGGDRLVFATILSAAEATRPDPGLMDLERWETILSLS